MNKIKAIVTFALLTALTQAMAGPIQNPKTRWKFQTAGTVRTSFVSDAQLLYFGSNDGFLYAVNKSSGELAWKFQTGGAITSSPALSGSWLLASSRDNMVYALNSKTGQLQWKFQMQSLASFPDMEWEYFSAAPVISKDRAYIGSGDGNLYALSLSNGKLLWKFTTKGRIGAAPLIAGDVIYQPSHDGIVYAINAADGKALWNFETDGAHYDSRKFGWDRNSIYTTPILVDSLLVIGSRDGKGYCINVKTHKKKWDFTYGPTWCMSSSVENGIVYFGWSDNSYTSATDILTGKEKWKFKAGAMVYTKPLLTQDEVIVGSGDYNVYSLNKTTGEKNWDYRLDGAVFGSPYLDGNIIYVGCDDGAVYALEQGVKPIKAVFAPTPRTELQDRIFTVNKKVTPYLTERGFLQLDSAKLYQFLTDRVNDKVPSVIVFQYELIPDNVIGSDPSQGLLRKYLDAGGKILWFGNVLSTYKFNAKGQPSGRDTSVATKLLGGVEYNNLVEGGHYSSKATQTGLNWGIPSSTALMSPNVSATGIIPLAYDEFNRPTSWLKKFNTRPGSGFISCRSWGYSEPIQDEDLKLIYKMAIHELE